MKTKRIVIAILAVVCLVGSAFAEVPSRPVFISLFFPTDLVEYCAKEKGSLMYKDFAFPGSDGGYGSCQLKYESLLELDFKLPFFTDVEFIESEWTFYTDEKDSSQWFLVLQASGTLDEKRDEPIILEGLHPQTLDGWTNRSGVEMSWWLRQDQIKRLLKARMRIAPSEVWYTHFVYDEVLIYEAPDDCPECPSVITTQWSIILFAEGQFIAETKEEAKALGALFVGKPGESSGAIGKIRGTLSGMPANRED